MVSGAGEFDVYQTAAGYVAVTNPVRRQILAALVEEPRDLPHLMDVTGKSKPTLSNVHMRELLSQGVIEEMPHPTDARRKLFRLVARRIGSSSVPIEDLRGAVKRYVGLSPFAFALGLRDALAVLASGDASAATLQRQGHALGLRAASAFPQAATPRDVLSAIAAFWEREKVARPTRLDFEKLEIEITFEVEATPAWGEAAAATPVLAGMLAGVLSARLAAPWTAEARRAKAGRALLAATPG